MRYLPHTNETRQKMLDDLGYETVDDLFLQACRATQSKASFNLPDHQSEKEVDDAFKKVAAKNIGQGDNPFFLGAGMYYHHIPAAVDALIQRGEFLTSYTPYQPEISQGTLQYLFEFQTQVAMLTGMDVANASMYDGATATYEAVSMANRITKRKKVITSGGLHPHYCDVLSTFKDVQKYDLVLAPPPLGKGEDLIPLIDDVTSCVVIQYPNFFGTPSDLTSLSVACHEKGALLIVVVNEVIALGLLKSPGEMGADIVAGEGQSIGNAMTFGGPSIGLLATRETYVRQMPGRLVGQTVDTDGKRGWVLTLSAREQHIRREKATSNICTNSGLCALAFTIHLSLLGTTGLKRLAKLNHHQTLKLKDKIEKIDGIQVCTESFFNEITLRLPFSATSLTDFLAQKGIIAGLPLSRVYPDLEEGDAFLVCAVTEMTTDEHICALIEGIDEFQKSLSTKAQKYG